MLIVVVAKTVMMMTMTMTTILRLSVEYATREVSRPSFTVKTSLLSRATKLVSIGNIAFH